IVKSLLKSGMPGELTVTVWVPGARSGGICRLICVGETKYRGRRRGPICTVTSARVCTRGLAGPTAVVAARVLPKMDATDPGATPVCCALPAPLLTPRGAIRGTMRNCVTTLCGMLMLSDPLGADPDRSPAQLLNR